LQPVDRLTLAFIAALGAIALARLPRPGTTVVALVVLAAAVVATAASATASRSRAFIHDFFPVVSIVCIFSLCGPLIEVASPARWDDTLAEIDRALFGTLPAVWHGFLGRPWWLTDAASIAYVSYYVIPVAVAGTLWRRRRAAEFERFVFAVVATFFASYVGYFLMPASGPRVPREIEAAVLGGGRLSAAVRDFLHVFELNRLDAFPSGHTAIALVYTAMAWRLLPAWRLPLVVALVGMLFATVYLSLHYVVDLVAGALLAGLMPALLPPLRRIFGDSSREDRLRPTPARMGSATPW
jgi:membrane-associated phospholipid phosphatase